MSHAAFSVVSDLADGDDIASIAKSNLDAKIEQIKAGVKDKLKAELRTHAGLKLTGSKAALQQRVEEARAAARTPADPAAEGGVDDGYDAEAEAEELSRDDAPDDSLLQDGDDDQDEELMPELEEDGKSKALTAIAIWHASILHQEDVHARVADPDDL